MRLRQAGRDSAQTGLLLAPSGLSCIGGVNDGQNQHYHASYSAARTRWVARIPPRDGRFRRLHCERNDWGSAVRKSHFCDPNSGRITADLLRAGRAGGNADLSNGGLYRLLTGHRSSRFARSATQGPNRPASDTRWLTATTLLSRRRQARQIADLNSRRTRLGQRQLAQPKRRSFEK